MSEDGHGFVFVGFTAFVGSMIGEDVAIVLGARAPHTAFFSSATK